MSAFLAKEAEVAALVWAGLAAVVALQGRNAHYNCPRNYLWIVSTNDPVDCS